MENGSLGMQFGKMNNIRIIPRLDIKGPNLIKGINLEGLRVLGLPNDFAKNYYHQGADELLYMDSVASLFGRNHLGDTIKNAVKDIFIPITVGGGIRSVNDAEEVLQVGGDKVAINSAAVTNPQLITDIAMRFGSQSTIISIEAKQLTQNKWEVYTKNGRERSGLDVLDWAKLCESNGAGEILLTSIDKEGTRKGFDIDLVKAVSELVSIPIIASGGMGCLDDLVKVINEGDVQAVAIADLLHYKRSNIREIREFSRNSGHRVRQYA